MAAEPCALDALLKEGGPVRLVVRPCCLAALVGRAALCAVADREADIDTGLDEIELQVTP